MIETIINYLNARLATLGRIDTTYCLTERRKREGEAVATIPYAYTGGGEFRPVDVDNGSSAWWRARTGWSKEPVTVVGRAVKQQRGTYPLRLFVLLRRKDSVSDDAMMPARLADDLSELLNFENGDLQLMLNADTVSVRASNADPDTTRIYQEEFSTPVADLHYTLCMVAVDVTVDVVADYKCWQGECDTDPDILRLFNFCDGSVTARLTPEQVGCLQAAFPTPCEDATAQLNGITVGTIPSGGEQSFPVLQNGLPVGTWNGTEWVIDPCEDATFTLEDTNGNTLDSGSIPSGGSDVIVAPNASVGINGNAGLFTVPSGSPINIGVEDSDGNPTGEFDPNTNSWVIPPCPPSGVSLSVTVSDTTPNIGDTVTITATPSSGFVPTEYTFWLEDGTTAYLLAKQAGNTLNVLVDVVGAWSIRVEAVQGTDRAWGVETVTVDAGIPTNGLRWWADPILRQRVSGVVYEDFGPNDLIGTFVNAPAISQGGGGSVTYNGISQRIGDIGNSGSFAFVKNTHQFTFSFFARWNNLTQRAVFGNALGTSENGFGFLMDSLVSNRFRFGINRGVSGQILIYESPDNPITDTNWHHVTITCDGIGNAQYYLDGVALTTTTVIQGTPALGTGNDTRPMELGAASWVPLFFNGQIGPSLAYDRALSAAEVGQVFDYARNRYGL